MRSGRKYIFVWRFRWAEQPLCHAEIREIFFVYKFNKVYKFVNNCYKFTFFIVYNKNSASYNESNIYEIEKRGIKKERISGMKCR